MEKDRLLRNTCGLDNFDDYDLSKMELKDLKEIERSIIKKYRKYIWSNFIKGIKEYKLIEEGDKIAVAISGGKDSLLLAKLIQELEKHGLVNFKAKYIAMDPGYHPLNRDRLEKNCSYLGIPVEIYRSDVFEVSQKLASDYPCYMCARMRRGSLYAKAKELSCNKLALGHHFNDVIETTMLNLLKAGSFKTMLPKLKADNFENMELIRPMYLIREESIVNWIDWTGLKALDCACTVASKKTGSTRHQIKYLIYKLKEIDKNVDMSIFKAQENINLDMCLGYIKNGEKRSFLDDYEK